jgi:uridine phosphorylase
MTDHDPWLESFRETAMGWLLGPDADPGKLPRVVLLPMENPDLYDGGWIKEQASHLEQQRTLTIGNVRGTRIAFSSPKFGAPAVAMAVDVFARAGFRAVVGVGFCGGLQSQVTCGDLILPSAAVRGEGASRAYAPESYPAVCSGQGFTLAQKCAADAGIALTTGMVWSTDGILRETRPQVEQWHNAGLLGVDMETAGLYTVASLRGVEAIAILVASDNVYERRQADLEGLRRGWRSATSLALAVCVRLTAAIG